MLSFLPPYMLAFSCIVLAVLITLICAVPVYILALSKFFIRFTAWQQKCALYLMITVKAWIWGILRSVDLTQKIFWNVTELPELHTNEWYFVNSNHQSWTDIIVLLKIFADKIPFPKFFLKQELFWIPILGTAWWALDYPFMKRYSKNYLKKHPEKRGLDVETTRKACERFQHTPVSILNFAEGTRFTPTKHAMQHSPYRHLLRPKAGGFAFTLNAMNGRINNLIDVTIVYPEGPIRFWNFLCGRVSHIVVRVKKYVIPNDLLSGDYRNDPAYRERLQAWLSDLWVRKDAMIDEILSNATQRILSRSL